ncbi:LGFP repeat-containing protein [Kineococcus sp. SYSU DK006]|uniref:LGFP repeat-containing protein n=1 Tax=Kineococcus sp. SYSU DK006 TaxID=3383127 RepID=UPI003D7D91C5
MPAPRTTVLRTAVLRAAALAGTTCLGAALLVPASASAAAADPTSPAATAGSAVPRAQRATSPLSTTTLCAQDGATLSVSWRRPDEAERYDVVGGADDETFLTATGAVGDAQPPVRLSEPVGTSTVRLLQRPEGTEVARRSATVAPCDGWSGPEQLEASGSNTPGQPQWIGQLEPTPTTVGGVRVWNGQLGALHVGADGRGHVVRNATAERYRAAGGPAGPLGAPTSSEVRTADDSGTSTTFAGGRIWFSPATGAHVVRGDDALWNDPHQRQRLMPFTVPGYPVAEAEELGALASRQRFERGWRYRSLEGGRWVWNSPVAERWLADGAEHGPLGWPLTDTEPLAMGWIPDGAAGDAWRQRFQGGTLYAPASAGAAAHLVGGAIAERYQGPRWSDEATMHRLGLPVTDELGTPDGVGRYNHFASGASIYWTPSTGAHVVTDLDDSGWWQPVRLRSYWAARGFERGVLGYPTGEAVESSSGGQRAALQRFSGGVLCASPDPAAPTTYLLATVHGAFRTHWEAAGADRSPLGMPTSEEVAVPGGVRQRFTGGELHYEAATGRVTQVLTTS